MALPLLFAQAGLGMLGTLLGYESEIDTAVRNARELDRAAALEDANAVDALRQGAQAAGRARMEGSVLAARQRLAYAGSGVDLTVGTPAQVQASTELLSEYDAQVAKNNSLRAAFGFKESARRHRVQREEVLRGASNALPRTLLGLGGQALGLAGQAYGGGR